jgi:NAD(P)-dependent dehydrogenase (short-subunit alcohol dehydrogenase family)
MVHRTIQFKGGSMALKVWFITGASKGFGLEISKAALAAGDSVVATARDPKSIVKVLGGDKRLLTLPLDVELWAGSSSSR